VLARLVRAWTDDGFVTMRIEKRGIGDSEGDPADFAQEIDDVRAAFEDLQKISSDVFVFGHSVGGIIAPRIEGARGIITYGTTVRAWSVCLRESMERQIALRGVKIDIEKEFSRVESDPYERQIDIPDWSKVTCPVLALRGEHDWVVSDADQREPLEIAPKLDHWMTKHASLEESVDTPARGDWDPWIADRTSAWMKSVLAR
jgi:alpha-beta hydrolase superfamily lysophospholipase